MHKHILFFALMFPSLSGAECLVGDADGIYRSYTEESSKIKSSDDTKIFSYLSERTAKIGEDSISRLTAETVASEDLEKFPILGNKLEIRKRLAVMALKSGRRVLPEEITPTVSVAADGITLRYVWQETKERFEEREKVQVNVVTDHTDEIMFVCQGTWKIDSEKHEHKSQVFTKSGAPIKHSYLGGGATYVFPTPETGLTTR